MRKRGYYHQWWEQVQFKYNDYIGVPVIITYDDGQFEVAVQGVQESTLTSDVTSPPQPSWYVSFHTYSAVEAELIFTEPCIDDYNPQQG